LFVQCALYTVLRVRGVYPEESFRRRRIFGHPCWWSESAEVEEYVTRLCDSLRPAICRDRLRRVLIPMHAADGALQERYTIEFPGDPQRLAEYGPEEVERALALVLTKLEMSPAFLNNSVAEAKGFDAPAWSVLVETREVAVDAVKREEALGPRWEASAGRSGSRGPTADGMVLHPLKSLVAAAARPGEAAAPVVLNLYVEEQRSR